MYGTIWSLLPFALVIPISIMTRQVIPGLVAGLLAGAYMMAPSPLGGVNQALYYLFKELAVAGNLHLIVFLYTFGSLVGLVRITGGVSGFAKWLGPRVKSVRGAYAVTWLSSLGTFMAPDFRIITVAPIMRSMMERFHISPQKMAYAIDVTSTPLISLIPVGTAFVGYMVGLLAVSLKHIHSTQAPYPLFLSTIPLNFFAIAILAIGAYLSFFSPQTRAPHRAETVAAERAPVHGRTVRRLRADAGQSIHAAVVVAQRQRSKFQVEAGSVGHPERRDAEETPMVRRELPEEPLDVLSEEAIPAAANLLLPIALLLGLTFFLTWWSGVGKAATFLGVLMNADAVRAMLQSILITLVVSSVYYLFRRQRVGRLMYGIIAGGNEMLAVIMLLVLVWAVSGVSTDLGFSDFVGRTMGAAIPRMFIAPALFIFGSVISYFIGSSFGTWGILIPLGFSLAATTHASLPLIAAAVFASGTLGGFASPLSDNTVAMATVMKLPLVDFANSLLKTTLIAGGIAAVGYAAAGFVM
ncbi:MAG: Na+/H+ antiporter NhaC family protein [Bacilli bacterium]